MKITSATAALLLFSAMISCNSNEKEPTPAENAKPKEETQMPVKNDEPVNKFAGISFASNRDTTCGMPLSAGIADTAMVDGKTYGFCAKECKDEFLAQHSAKKGK